MAKFWLNGEILVSHPSYNMGVATKIVTSTAPSLSILVDPKLVMQKAAVGLGMQVADLGCGSHGTFVFAAAHTVGDNGIVYAVDIQPSVIEAIKSKKSIWPNGDRVELIWADLEKSSSTTIPPGSIDVALLINTLHQSKNQEKIIENAIPLIKKGGTILVIDWKTHDVSFAPRAVRPVNFSELEKFCVGAGMKLVDKFNASRYHDGLKFEV